MVINYDIPKINRMLKDFYNATGINMDLLKDDFSFVGNQSFWENKRYCRAVQNTVTGMKACFCSDAELLKKSRDSKQVEMHVCHAGLVDVAVPIIYNEAIIGYVIFGQIKMKEDFSRLRKYISDIGLDENEMEGLYNEIEIISEDRIQSISNLAQMIVKHILLENMLRPDIDDNIQKAVYYINENLAQPLSVQSISKNAGISKSALYRGFHAHFGCTVSHYISKARIEKAIVLLADNNLSIEEIALRVGFADGSYFSKSFKKEKGMSPLKYRKKSREKSE